MTDLESNGWNDSGLKRLVSFAEESGTAQIVIRHRSGFLIDEIFDPKPVDVYAVQKGILSLLFGIAEEKYLLEICDAINHHLAPEWTRLSPWTEASLTIEGLLQMVTGMDDELSELGTVGETWRYNNTAYNYLKKILCLHTDQTLAELSNEWLFSPLKMSETQWEERPNLLPDGTHFTGLKSTARDLSQVGMMLLDKGHYDGRQIVPSYYLELMAQPGSKENPAWGLCWWNNNQDSFKVPMREGENHEGNILPNAPRDLIAARGALGNYLYVIPSLELVVARTAQPIEVDSKPSRFEQPFFELLMQAQSA